MIVVDASAMLEALLQAPAASEVRTRILARTESLHAPHLLDLEVAQVLRRFAAAGRIDQQQARSALDNFADMSVRRYSHRNLLPRVWALRHVLTAYDAVYVALAEALQAPLVTCDGRLGRAVGHRAQVEIIGRPN